MSSQSILDMNPETLFSEYDEELVCYADSFFIRDKFLVGEEIDFDRISHIINFHRLLCSDNCELVDFINDKIAGKLDCKYEKISENIKEYKEHCKIDNCSDTDVIGECCAISNIASTKW